MSVFPSVFAARYMNPVVLAILRFQDELVEVSMLLEVVEPPAGDVHVGVLAIVVPRGVGSLGQADVGRFAQGVLTGVYSAHLHVEGTAAIAGADDDGHACKRPERLQDGAAQLLQGREKPKPSL